VSVPAWAHSSKPTAAGLLLWARRAGDIDRLLKQRREQNGLKLDAKVHWVRHAVILQLFRSLLFADVCFMYMII